MVTDLTCMLYPHHYRSKLTSTIKAMTGPLTQSNTLVRIIKINKFRYRRWHDGDSLEENGDASLNSCEPNPLQGSAKSQEDRSQKVSFEKFI